VWLVEVHVTGLSEFKMRHLSRVFICGKGSSTKATGRSPCKVKQTASFTEKKVKQEERQSDTGNLQEPTTGFNDGTKQEE